jgi:hypothetical protein
VTTFAAATAVPPSGASATPASDGRGRLRPNNTETPLPRHSTRSGREEAAPAPRVILGNHPRTLAMISAPRPGRTTPPRFWLSEREPTRLREPSNLDAAWDAPATPAGAVLVLRLDWLRLREPKSRAAAGLTVAADLSAQQFDQQSTNR